MGGLADCRQAAKRASECIRLSVSGSEDNAALQDVIAKLRGDLSGSLSEFNGALRDVTELRQAALSAVRDVSRVCPARVQLLCDVLGACARFLLRYLGSADGSQSSDPKAKAAFEKRIELISPLLKTAVESVIFAIRKLSHLIEDGLLCSRNLDVCRMILDRKCQNLQKKLWLWNGDDESTQRALVLNLSNSYWTLSTSIGSPQSEKATLTLMHSACEVLREADVEVQTSGSLALRLCHFGRASLKAGKTTLAKQAFGDAVMVCVEGGSLQHAVHLARTGPLRLLREDDTLRIMTSALKGYLHVGVSLGTENALFDADLTSRSDRVSLIEWQLDLIEDSLPSTKLPAGLTDLAAVYNTTVNAFGDSNATPDLQNLRLLLKLLHLAIESQNASVAALVELTKAALDSVETIDCSTDALGPFEADLRASALVELALASASKPSESFEAALELWRSLVSTQDMRISTRIGDPKGWARRLRLIAAFFDLQGLESQCLTTLALMEHARHLESSQTGEANIYSTLDSPIHFLSMGFGETALDLAARIQLAPSTTPQSSPSFDQRIQAFVLDALQRQKLELTQPGTKLLLSTLEDFFAEAKMNLRSMRPDDAFVSVLVPFFFSQTPYLLQSEGPATTLRLSKIISNLLLKLWALITPTDSPHVDPYCANSETGTKCQGPERERPTPFVWPLLARLVESFLLVARLSKRFGFLQDAHNSTEQAHRLAIGASAEGLTNLVSIERGDTACRSDETDLGESHFSQALASVRTNPSSRTVVKLNKYFANYNRLRQDWLEESSAFERARKAIGELSEIRFLDEIPEPSSTQLQTQAQTDRLVTGLSELSVNERRPPKAPTIKKRPGKTEKATTKAPVVKAPSKTIQTQTNTRQRPAAWKDADVDILRRKAESLTLQEEYVAARQILDSLPLQNQHERAVLKEAALAECGLRESLSDMAIDTVYALLSESAICIPAIDSPSPPEESRSTTEAKANTSKKTPSEPRRHKSKSTSAGFLQPLKSALEHLGKVEGLHRCSHYTVTRVADLQAACGMISSATALSRQYPLSTQTVARHLELPRIAAFYRERDAALIEKSLKDVESLSEDDSLIGTHETLAIDDASFQTNFLDIIPPQWTTVSLTLSENLEHLYIARYISDSTPIVVRIPLARESAEDASDASMTYTEARDDLQTIIAESDATIARAKGGEGGAASKAVKEQWWAEREALDDRIQALLLNIENLWLGGFKGLLNPLQTDKSALKKFEVALVGILDTYLPSRQRKASAVPLRLSSHIAALYTSLPDPRDPAVDLDEPLLDLLYFTVDTLQFAGERNAYDEVDWDAMTIAATDVLKTYHEAATPRDSHLILVLDNRLHIFPWESLPILHGTAVSRVFSLADVRERVLAMPAQPSPQDLPKPGILLNPERGTLMLNPGADLPKTQSRFAKPFSTSPTTATWTQHTATAPSQSTFLTALSPPSSLLVYIGHGSGSQYLRSKALRRLAPRCAAALLFGCSSAALRTAGQFAPLGTPRSYLVAGAPVVLGALWDVTDGDVDAFAGACLARFGILEPGTRIDVGRGRRAKVRRNLAAEHAGVKRDRNDGSMGLDEAVAESRGECYLRYLNGAAMVVYGVPCFLGRAESE